MHDRDFPEENTVVVRLNTWSVHEKRPIFRWVSFRGTLGAIRTHDLWLRKPTLYPAELRVQIIVNARYSRNSVAG